jgi:hypothetical protein
MPASWVEFKMSNALVAKICFSDGVCWAAKMQERDYYDAATERGITAMVLIEQYCPNIPINRYKGTSYRKLRYLFAEWVEGNIYPRECGDIRE